MTPAAVEPAQDNPLWDIPTRVFHWAIVCLLPLAWVSAEEQCYAVHQWVGYTMLVLVVSRILWGFVGSRHSRFVDFLVGPNAVGRYLQGGAPPGPGHNPLGGWSVLLLLTLLLVQAVSGLFNSDGILFSGPLYYWADRDVQNAMGATHEFAFNMLLGFVSLHLAAVLYHQLCRREKLVQAMIRGSAPGRDGQTPVVSWWRVIPIVLLVSAALWWIIRKAPGPVYLGF